MGASLPAAVSTIVVRRENGVLFQVGLAEMNGWRSKMEDAHLVHIKDSWGFFGVFDGHGGEQCSQYIARRMREELEKNEEPPSDDAAVKELALRLDAEFLDAQHPSGSTATFAIAKPGEEPGTFLLRVGNIGDSRVLLGRMDGTMVEHTGSDGCLTADHKPDRPDERERIYRCGGFVDVKMGIPRVDGDLAVSRAFGDARHKQSGGPAQEDHPVSAEPEFTTLTCQKTDFVMLVCDGISEANFPNREVVSLAAEKMRSCPDPADAAAAVCNQALKSGSKDNMSCMIVLLEGGDMQGPAAEFRPGPFRFPKSEPFRKAYEAMARHVDKSLAEAVEMRYDIACQEKARWDESVIALQERVHELMKQRHRQGGLDEAGSNELAQLEEERKDYDALATEVQLFVEGPPGDLSSEARTQWFATWLEEQNSPDASREPNAALMSLLGSLPARPSGDGRRVRLAERDALYAAVEEHNALKWTPQCEDVCGKTGVVQKEESDGTSQVLVPTDECPQGVLIWVPTSTITDEAEPAL